MFDINKIRNDFPILKNGFCYLDNAATTQRPKQVVNSMCNFYLTSNGSVNKGFYEQSLRASDDYENARKEISTFINAKCEEIVFCSNTTDGINLFAQSYGFANLRDDNEIVVCILEHHSNFLPWQNLVNQKNIKIRYLYCDKQGNIDENDLKVINQNTKIVAVTYVSNVLGNINHIDKIVEIAHKNGAFVVVDGAQAVSHFPIDVKKSSIDVLAFSGHKMLGPYGIGVLYIDESIHKYLQPSRSGGGMVETVTKTHSIFSPMPYCLECGTKNIEAAIGLASAVKYFKSIGWNNIFQQESQLISYLMCQLKKIKGVHILGSENPDNHAGIVSVVVDGWHPHDIACLLAEKNIAVRAGTHCAQPLHNYMGLNSSLRFSISFYNTKEEIEILIHSLKDIILMNG